MGLGVPLVEWEPAAWGGGLFLTKERGVFRKDLNGNLSTLGTLYP